MFKLITELLSAYTELKKLSKTINKELRVANRIFKSPLFSNLRKIQRKASLFSNPNQAILNLFTKLPDNELKKFQGQLNTVLRQRNLHRVIQQQRKKRPLTVQEQQQFEGNENNLPKNEVIINSSLSSSWLQFGHFIETSRTGAGKIIGSLALTVKTGKGKTYDYFNVSYSTWLAMTKQTGLFGSGAGSVFWARYLHAYTAGKKAVRT